MTTQDSILNGSILSSSTLNKGALDGGILPISPYNKYAKEKKELEIARLNAELAKTVPYIVEQNADTTNSIYDLINNLFWANEHDDSKQAKTVLGEYVNYAYNAVLGNITGTRLDVTAEDKYTTGYVKNGWAALVNTLNEVGEDMDVLANDVKAIVGVGLYLLTDKWYIEGQTVSPDEAAKLYNAWSVAANTFAYIPRESDIAITARNKYRKALNYQFDGEQDFHFGELLAELVSDPLDWITFGASTAAKAGAKAVVKTTADEAAEASVKILAKELSKLDDFANASIDTIESAARVEIKKAQHLSNFKTIHQMKEAYLTSSDSFVDATKKYVLAQNAKNVIADTAKLKQTARGIYEAQLRKASFDFLTKNVIGASSNLSSIGKIAQGVLKGGKADTLRDIASISNDIQKGILKVSLTNTPLAALAIRRIPKLIQKQTLQAAERTIQNLMTSQNLSREAAIRKLFGSDDTVQRSVKIKVAKVKTTINQVTNAANKRYKNKAVHNLTKLFMMETGGQVYDVMRNSVSNIKNLLGKTDEHIVKELVVEIYNNYAKLLNRFTNALEALEEGPVLDKLVQEFIEDNNFSDIDEFIINLNAIDDMTDELKEAIEALTWRFNHTLKDKTLEVKLTEEEIITRIEKRKFEQRNITYERYGLGDLDGNVIFNVDDPIAVYNELKTRLFLRGVSEELEDANDAENLALLRELKNKKIVLDARADRLDKYRNSISNTDYEIKTTIVDRRVANIRPGVITPDERSFYIYRIEKQIEQVVEGEKNIEELKGPIYQEARIKLRDMNTRLNDARTKLKEDYLTKPDDEQYISRLKKLDNAIDNITDLRKALDEPYRYDKELINRVNKLYKLRKMLQDGSSTAYYYTSTGELIREDIGKLINVKDIPKERIILTEEEVIKLYKNNIDRLIKQTQEEPLKSSDIILTLYRLKANTIDKINNFYLYKDSKNIKHIDIRTLNIKEIPEGYKILTETEIRVKHIDNAISIAIKEKDEHFIQKIIIGAKNIQDTIKNNLKNLEDKFEKKLYTYDYYNKEKRRLSKELNKITNSIEEWNEVYIYRKELITRLPQLYKLKKLLEKDIDTIYIKNNKRIDAVPIKKLRLLEIPKDSIILTYEEALSFYNNQSSVIDELKQLHNNKIEYIESEQTAIDNEYILLIEEFKNFQDKVLNKSTIKRFSFAKKARAVDYVKIKTLENNFNKADDYLIRTTKVPESPEALETIMNVSDDIQAQSENIATTINSIDKSIVKQIASYINIKAKEIGSNIKLTKQKHTRHEVLEDLFEEIYREEIKLIKNPYDENPIDLSKIKNLDVLQEQAIENRRLRNMGKVIPYNIWEQYQNFGIASADRYKYYTRLETEDIVDRLLYNIQEDLRILEKNYIQVAPDLYQENFIDVFARLRTDIIILNTLHTKAGLDAPFSDEFIKSISDNINTYKKSFKEVLTDKAVGSDITMFEKSGERIRIYSAQVGNMQRTRYWETHTGIVEHVDSILDYVLNVNAVYTRELEISNSVVDPVCNAIVADLKMFKAFKILNDRIYYNILNNIRKNNWKRLPNETTERIAKEIFRKHVEDKLVNMWHYNLADKQLTINHIVKNIMSEIKESALVYGDDSLDLFNDVQQELEQYLYNVRRLSLTYETTVKAAPNYAEFTITYSKFIKTIEDHLRTYKPVTNTIDNGSDQQGILPLYSSGISGITLVQDGAAWSSLSKLHGNLINTAEEIKLLDQKFSNKYIIECTDNFDRYIVRADGTIEDLIKKPNLSNWGAHQDSAVSFIQDATEHAVTTKRIIDTEAAMIKFIDIKKLYMKDIRVMERVQKVLKRYEDLLKTINFSDELIKEFDANSINNIQIILRKALTKLDNSDSIISLIKPIPLEETFDNAALVNSYISTCMLWDAFTRNLDKFSYDEVLDINTELNNANVSSNVFNIIRKQDYATGKLPYIKRPTLPINITYLKPNVPISKSSPASTIVVEPPSFKMNIFDAVAVAAFEHKLDMISSFIGTTGNSATGIVRSLYANIIHRDIQHVFDYIKNRHVIDIMKDTQQVYEDAVDHIITENPTRLKDYLTDVTPGGFIIVEPEMLYRSLKQHSKDVNQTDAELIASPVYEDFLESLLKNDIKISLFNTDNNKACYIIYVDNTNKVVHKKVVDVKHFMNIPLEETFIKHIDDSYYFPQILEQNDYEHLLNAIPEYIRNDLMDIDGLISSGFFDTTHCDTVLIGSESFRRGINGLHAYNIYEGHVNVCNYINNRITLREALIEVFCDPNARLTITNLFPNVSTKDMLQEFKKHPELVGMMLTSDRHGVRLIKSIPLDSAKNIELASTSNAIIVSSEEFNKFARIINNNELPNNLSIGILKTISSITKAGFLSTPGWLVRNAINSIAKSIGDSYRSVADIPERVAFMKRSFQTYFKYRDMYNALCEFSRNYFQKNGMKVNGLWNTISINKFFEQAEYAPYRDWFLEIYNNFSTSEVVGLTGNELEHLEKAGIIRSYKFKESLGHIEETIASRLGKDISQLDKNSIEYKITYAETIAEILAWKNPFTGFLINANALLEQLVRFDTFLWETELGQTTAQALATVERVHFNYNTAPGIVQKAELIVPFINFRFMNTIFWINELAKNPRILRDFNKWVEANGLDDRSEESETSDIKLSTTLLSGGFEIGDSDIFVKVNSDLIAALETAFNPIEDITQSVLGYKTVDIIRRYKDSIAATEKEYQEDIALAEYLQGVYKTNKIEAATRARDSQLAYYNEQIKEVTLGAVPLIGPVIQRGTNFYHTATKLYRISDELQAMDNEVTQLVSAAMSSVLSYIPDKYYYSYGNKNYITTNYEKYLEAINKKEEAAGTPGWAGYSKEIEEYKPTIYYMFSFPSSSEIYYTKDIVKFYNAVMNGGQPNNAAAIKAYQSFEDAGDIPAYSYSKPRSYSKPSYVKHYYAQQQSLPKKAKFITKINTNPKAIRYGHVKSVTPRAQWTVQEIQSKNRKAMNQYKNVVRLNSYNIQKNYAQNRISARAF